MNRNYGNAYYTTQPVDDKLDGYSGLELYRSRKERKDRVARVVFWDASGQFAFETFGTELPLEIVEELIAEVRAKVKIS